LQFGDMEESETEAVVALWHRCDLVRPWNDPRRDIALASATTNARMLVGRVDGMVRASAMLGFDGHRGWAYYVAVDPALQGAGHGRALMAEAERWLRAQGAPKMQLMVRNTNAGVLGFYEKLGFTDQGTVVLGKFF
jgi:ribosomal protein S18 acetylase RimI-like enzyme